MSYQLDFPHSVRMMTVFFYLNDPDAGGETYFPLLDVTVSPKRGRAILWPTVLNDDPFAEDRRLRHEGMDVKHGVKYASIACLHQKDWVTPWSRGCAE